MEGASKYPIHETDSESESDAESDDNEVSEGFANPLSKWRKIKVAVACDTPILVGIEAERKTSEGGQQYVLGVANLLEIGLQRSNKLNHIVSRIAWQKAFPHE